MPTYTLTQDQRLHLLASNGEQLPLTHLLSIYPTRKVIAMHGQMGAGKTTLLKQLCEEMGVLDTVNSPTFAIVNVYETSEHKEIYHFDCYRLKNIGEALDFGAEDYIHSGNYCFIEWPDIIEDLLPEDTLHLYIQPLPSGDRQISIQ